MTSPSTVLEIDIRSAVWKGVATLYGYTAKPGISEPATPKGSQHPGTTLPAPSTQHPGLGIPDSRFGIRIQDAGWGWDMAKSRPSTQQPSAEVLDRPQGSKHSSDPGKSLSPSRWNIGQKV